MMGTQLKDLYGNLPCPGCHSKYRLLESRRWLGIDIQHTAIRNALVGQIKKHA